jgi:hypothetical protein
MEGLLFQTLSRVSEGVALVAARMGHLSWAWFVAQSVSGGRTGAHRWATAPAGMTEQPSPRPPARE